MPFNFIYSLSPLEQPPQPEQTPQPRPARLRRVQPGYLLRYLLPSRTFTCFSLRYATSASFRLRISSSSPSFFYSLRLLYSSIFFARSLWLYNCYSRARLLLRSASRASLRIRICFLA